MVNDKGLYDISQCPNTVCVRHALALFEDRSVKMPLQYFYDKVFPTTRGIDPTEGIEKKAGDPPDFQEAWFAGTHSDIGGSCLKDGLSLWPGQWMLSEARKAGLAVGFKKSEQYPIPDPSRCLIPKGAQNGTVILQNGTKIQLTSLEQVFKEPRFTPQVNKGPGVFRKERALFDQNGTLIGSVTNGKWQLVIHLSKYF